MIELPEAVTLARQLGEALAGRTIVQAVANSSPHRFAWYSGDPATYGARTAGCRIAGASSFGGLVEVATDSATLVLGEGAYPRILASDEAEPARHQLLVELDDGTRFVVSVVMPTG